VTGKYRLLALKLCLSLSVTVIFFGGIELVVRALNMAPPRGTFRFMVRQIDNDVEYTFMDYDPELLWSPRPGWTGSHPLGAGTLTINSAGMRDYEYTVDKGERVFRILSLGDSSTFGFKVRLTEIYHSVLEERLNSSAAPGGARYEVLNAGVTGYTSAQCLAMYIHRGRRFKPDLVTIMIGANDMIRNPALPDNQLLKNRSKLLATPQSALEALAIFRLLRSWVHPPQVHPPPPPPPPPDDLTEEEDGPDAPEEPEVSTDKERVSLADFKKNIAELNRRVLEDGAKLVMINYTNTAEVMFDPTELYLTVSTQQYRDATEEVAREQGIPLLTVKAMTERSKLKDQGLFLDRVHPTPRGHRLLAGRLHAFLIEKGFLPKKKKTKNEEQETRN